MGASARAGALVLDLDTRAGLSIARSLGRAGYPVSIAARDGHSSGMRTRYAQHRAVLPDPEEDFQAYAAAVIAELEAHPVDAVLASIDSSVEVLHRFRDAVGRLASPALGDPEAVEIALSKELTLEVAGSLGVPVPRSLLVSTPGEVDAALAEIGIPCVFKPVSSWRSLGRGGERLGPVLVTDGDEGRRLGETMVRPEHPVLFQQLVGGVRETIKLFRVQGKTLVRVAMVTDRTWPPLGGSSVMRRTISPPDDTLADAEKLVAEIGLDGYSEVEFRRDGEGRALLMEINPRLSQSVELAVRAGVDFPRMQFEWARGGTVPVPARPVLGLRVGWPAGDLRLLVAALGDAPKPRPALSATVRSIISDYLFHHARLEGLDVRDLRPVLGGIRFALSLSPATRRAESRVT